MPTPPGCIPLSEFIHQLVRAQNIESTMLSLPLTQTMRHFFASAAVFFRRSRLFFREAAFSSGGEGCEWGAKQPTEGESGDKAENEFSGFIPLAVPRKGFSPHIPASRLFVLFHTTKSTIPSKKRNIPYWYCPL